MKQMQLMRIQAKAETETEAVFDIFDEIGETTNWWSEAKEGIGPNTVRDFLQANPNVQKIKVRIASLGGSAYDGIAVANLLRNSGKAIDVEIVSIAASAASIIAMAGDTVRIHPTAQLMVHRAWTYAMGNSNELATLAKDLDKLDQSLAEAYCGKSGMSKEEALELMDAESYLTADEAKALGLVDEIIGKKDPAEDTADTETKPAGKADAPAAETKPAAETPTPAPCGFMGFRKGGIKNAF